MNYEKQYYYKNIIGEVFMNIKNAEKLLNEFKKINLMPKRKETFMSISGYPHYENVVSNILKFFFEDNEHSMKNLWVRSLLEAVPFFSNVDFQDVVVEEVYREYITAKQKRIDLVVVCDRYIIAIENKIYANLTNDLQDYADAISKLNQGFGNGKIEVNVVLSLNTVDISKNLPNVQNLCNITYDMLFSKIKENIGVYMLDANNDWLIKMQDFIYTIEGLKGGAFMDKKFAEFLYANRNDISKMLDAMDAYFKSIKGETKGLKDALLADEGYKNFNTVLKTNNIDVVADYFNTNCEEQRLYACVYVNVIKSKEKVLTVETYIDGKGWHIVLWIRHGNQDALRSILEDNRVETIENPLAWNWWKGFELACVDVRGDEYQEVVSEIVNKGLDTALKVLNAGKW